MDDIQAQTEKIQKQLTAAVNRVLGKRQAALYKKMLGAPFDLAQVRRRSPAVAGPAIATPTRRAPPRRPPRPRHPARTMRTATRRSRPPRPPRPPPPSPRGRAFASFAASMSDRRGRLRSTTFPQGGSPASARGVGAGNHLTTLHEPGPDRRPAGRVLARCARAAAGLAERWLLFPPVPLRRITCRPMRPAGPGPFAPAKPARGDLPESIARPDPGCARSSPIGDASRLAS